jgi:hypothetical protein
LGFYRRNRSLFIVLLGAGMTATSLLWEYVRMKPDYRFIVHPWSLRGFETPQGRAISLIGVALILLAIPLSARILKGTLIQTIGVAAAFTAFAACLPVLAGAGTIALPGIATWGMAILAGYAALAGSARLIPKSLPPYARSLASTAVFVGVILLFGLLVFDSLFTHRKVALWLPVLVGMLLFDAVMLVRRPTELALYRLLVTGTVAGLVVALTCAGALRSTLLRLQVEQMGIGAEYRDIQITSGVMVAWVGGLIAFLGAMALWARRRDELAEHGRAKRQMDIARQSAIELGQTV